jgi:hypothetical protein
MKKDDFGFIWMSVPKNYRFVLRSLLDSPSVLNFGIGNLPMMEY